MKKVTACIALVVAMLVIMSACAPSSNKAKVNRDGEYNLIEMENDEYIYDKSAIESTGMDLSVTIKGTEARMISKSLDTDNKMTFDPDKSVFTPVQGNPIVVSFDGDNMIFKIDTATYKLEKKQP